MDEEEQKAAAEAARQAELAAAEEERKAAEEAARLAAEAEDEDGDDDNGVADLAEAKKALAEARKAEKKAKADAAKAKADAAKFKGIDPEKARADAKKVEEAEKAKRSAEKVAAEAAGNLERLRELQNEDHQRELSAERDLRTAAEARAAEAEARLARALVSTAFASSNFISGETVLSPAKAQRLYGDYVEIKDGEIIVYDKPAGEARRAIVMDSRGNALPFNDAIKKVIEADPDKDTFLKTKIKPGGGSKSDHQPSSADNGRSRIQKLSAGLKALNGG